MTWYTDRVNTPRSLASTIASVCHTQRAQNDNDSPSPHTPHVHYTAGNTATREEGGGGAICRVSHLMSQYTVYISHNKLV